MTLRRRLQRLERAGGGGEPCEECGGPPKPGERVEYEVVWEDLTELSDADDTFPEYCPECGQQLVFTVRWNDQGEGGHSRCLDVAL